MDHYTDPLHYKGRLGRIRENQISVGVGVGVGVSVGVGV